MSTACTTNVWVPMVHSGQPISVSGNTAGDRHSTNGSPSYEHSNVEPGSLELNAIPPVVLSVVPLGPPTIVVSGGFATSKLCSAGISPAIPNSLTARTSNRYSPSGRPVYVCGDSHAWNVLMWNGLGVIRHSNVAFGSSEVKVNVWLLPRLGSGGADSIVGSSGGAMLRQV
jgi:hypothetical protein